MKRSHVWTLGVSLVVLGIAAHWFGWDALLWFPREVFYWLTWAPAMILDAVEASPSTVGIIALGVVLMVAAKVWMRPRS